MTATALRPAAPRGSLPARSAPPGDRTALLLDVLMALSLGGGLLTVWSYLHEPSVPHGWTVGYLGVVLGMGALWVVLRRGERRSSSSGVAVGVVVALAVLALANLLLGGGAGAWPLFLMALLAVVRRLGLRGGVALCLGALVMQFVALLVVGRPAPEAAEEVGAAAFVSAFGLLLAWLMTEREQQHRRIEALLAEVEQGLATEIELVLADERTRAVRDLHDGLGHRLTLIGMQLTYAERVRESDPHAAWAQVERARVESTEALTTMRRWVRALSPARAATGLGALDTLAESFRGTGLDVVVRGTGPTTDQPGAQLDRATTLFVHRFVQEALTNVLRHSASAHVEVTYDHAQGPLTLEVADDGTPGATGRPAPAEGFGLRTLRERAEQLGGRVSTAWTSRGLVVSAELPGRGEGA